MIYGGLESDCSMIVMTSSELVGPTAGSVLTQRPGGACE